MKTFNIISADIITKAGTEPFVGLTVNVNGQQQQIARTCKQALLDLHKSARASNIPSGLFDNGVASANPLLLNQFRNAIIGLVGKVGIADVDFYEAGTEYEATEVSSAVKAGIAQVGDVLKTEKKGSRVEGFMSFPLTAEESILEQLVANNASAILDRIFGTVPSNVGGAGSDAGSDAGIKKDAEPEVGNNKEVLGAFTADDFPAPEVEELVGATAAPAKPAKK